jgi:predicted Zn-dependent protease
MTPEKAAARRPLSFRARGWVDSPVVLAVRAALVVLAAAVIAWMATQLTAVSAQERLNEIAFRATGDPTVEELTEADELVEKAERFNADRTPSLTRNVIYLRSGAVGPALRGFEAITREEPENVAAWTLLARAADRQQDEALAARARARQAELAPPVPAAPR